MSRFLKLERLDPYRLLAVFLGRARLGLVAAYDAAFAAAHRSSMLSREMDYLIFRAHEENVSHDVEIDELSFAAQAEDLQSDLHASTVVLAADDAIRRFAAGVLGMPLAFEPGFGPLYAGVPLTTLLRVGTNTIRHVSEWDDLAMPFPYRVDATLDGRTDREEKRALQSIRIIQRAFGIGIHDQIRDVVSFRILVAVDGLPAQPSYDRFEAALLASASAIAESVGPDASAALDAALSTTVSS
jgi:hypothetical protein